MPKETSQNRVSGLSWEAFLMIGKDRLEQLGPMEYNAAIAALAKLEKKHGLKRIKENAEMLRFRLVELEWL